MKKLLIIIATVLCLASCSKENAESSLAGTKWKNDTFLLVFDSSSICRIGFYMDNGDFTSNPARGTYQYENGHIEFTNLVYTSIFYSTEFYRADVNGNSMTVSYVNDPTNPFSPTKSCVLTKF